jgi:pimeloyl-ACP methyl ester carboxylesterase
MSASQLLAEQASQRGLARRVNVSGIDSAYWFYPAVSTRHTTSDAKTIVMVHGYRGTHAGLHAVAGALPEFNLIAPDLPGFGESDDLENEYTIENYANWLSEFVAALSLDKPILLAHSFGTLVASCAVSKGLNVEALVLLNPVSEPPQNKRHGLQYLGQATTNAYHWFANRLPSEYAMKLLKNKPLLVLMSRVLAKTKDRALYLWIVEQHRMYFSSFRSRRTAIEGYYASVSASVAEFASRIATPTLFIIGQWDDITSVAAQHRTSKLIPNAQVQQIARVGHLTHYETPEQVADLTRVFLEQV